MTCLRCGSRWGRLRTEGEQRQKAAERGSTTVMCKKCDQLMVIRVNNTDDSLLLGCSGFPRCRATQRYTPGLTGVQTTPAARSSTEVPPPPQTFLQQREAGMTPSRNEATFTRSVAQVARQLEGEVIVINDSDSVMMETLAEEEEERRCG